MWSGQEENRLGAVARIDGLAGQGAPGVKLRQFIAQLVVGGIFVEDEVVLLQAGDHAITGKHGGAFDHGGGADGVDTDSGRVGDGEFADQMAERGFGDVVRLSAALGDDRVGRAGEDDAGVDTLRIEDGLGFVGENEVGRDVDFEGHAPHGRR